MFKKLREKLKSVVKKISNKAEQESREEPKELYDKLNIKESIKKRVESKEKEKSRIIKETIEKESIKKKDIKKESITKELEKEEKKKKGIFSKIKRKLITTKINEDKFDNLFFELEVALLENNVAYKVIEKIKEELKERIVNKDINKKEVNRILFRSLKSALYSLYEGVEDIDLITLTAKYRPLIILFLGVNGSGKTTTIAKIAKLFLNNNKKVVIGASDTFRAAAIEQLEEHAKKLNVKIIKHNYGADPAAVAYDCVAYAKSKAVDVVLIDTAGRLHSNRNLMDELKKIVRVIKPNLKIFVGESITGNDCIEQAKLFNEHIGIDAVILTKADVDEKGGAALSISYIIKKPIIYIGTGQEYKDLIRFDKQKLVEGLFT